MEPYVKTGLINTGTNKMFSIQAFRNKFMLNEYTFPFTRITKGVTIAVLFFSDYKKLNIP